MSAAAWFGVVAVIVVIMLAIRLLIARAELAIACEAKDALAREKRELEVRCATLEREQMAWRDGDRIRRRAVKPSLIFPED